MDDFSISNLKLELATFCDSIRDDVCDGNDDARDIRDNCMKIIEPYINITAHNTVIIQSKYRIIESNYDVVVVNIDVPIISWSEINAIVECYPLIEVLIIQCTILSGN